jgi:hypothetical protein
MDVMCGVKRPRGGALTADETRYNACLSAWRGVAEGVNGRLKCQFPRLRFWTGRDDGSVLHAAWLLAAVAHNIYIARHPLVLPDRSWSWLLRGELGSSDPWVGGVPRMIGCGWHHDEDPPLPSHAG